MNNKKIKSADYINNLRRSFLMDICDSDKMLEVTDVRYVFKVFEKSFNHKVSKKIKLTVKEIEPRKIIDPIKVKNEEKFFKDINEYVNKDIKEKQIGAMKFLRKMGYTRRYI